jgi:hypothetical protein
MAAVLNATQSFPVYCVDNLHSPQIGSAYVPIEHPVTDLANGARIGYLYQHYAPLVTDADSGAGLQLAIWDVLFDNGDGLSSGTFQASSTSGTMIAATNDISGSAGHTAGATWYEGPAGANQPQGVVGANPVPEPASLAAVSLGIAALVRRRRAR